MTSERSQRPARSGSELPIRVLARVAAIPFKAGIPLQNKLPNVPPTLGTLSTCTSGMVKFYTQAGFGDLARVSLQSIFDEQSDAEEFEGSVIEKSSTVKKSRNFFATLRLFKASVERSP